MQGTIISRGNSDLRNAAIYNCPGNNGGPGVAGIILVGNCIMIGCLIDCMTKDKVKCLDPHKHRLYSVMGTDCPCTVAAGYIELSDKSIMKGWNIYNCVIKIPQSWSEWKRRRLKKANTFQNCRIE